MRSRQEKLAALRDMERVPVLVIGAGINGIGTFRDLALQGVDVLLVDRGDYCNGASMASSHMLHGGIRYLENGELRLVREALHERNRLLRNAPHQARPLSTAIPIFKRFTGLLNAPLKLLGLRGKPAERGAIVIKLGLLLYDLFARHEGEMPRHRFFGRADALRQWPRLAPGIVNVGRYHDAQLRSPERLCIEIIRDAEADHDGALALNYVSATAARDGRVELRDAVAGDIIEIEPQVVVNASGPWIDLTNQALGRSSRFIGGTKGSHIVVDHSALLEALNGHEMFFEHRDGRIVLICPFEDKVLIGTTDIRIDDPDEARCTDVEVDYMLGLVPSIFPDLAPSREQIVFRFSGVRPLPASPKGYTGNISRDHSIEVLEPSEAGGFAVLNLVGGKWTTFRAFSERVVDDLLPRLGESRRNRTADLEIGGGRGFPRTDADRATWIAGLAERFGLTPERALTLFGRYGTCAKAVAEAIARSTGDPALEALPAYSHAELRYLAATEQVVHLDDLVLRRSLIAWSGQAEEAVLAEIAAVIAPALGWDEQRARDESARAVALLAERHGPSESPDVARPT